MIILLTLNKQPASHFSRKVGLFGNHTKEFEFGTCGLMANHQHIKETKEKTILLERKGEFPGAIVNMSIGDTGSRRCGGFSLAEL